MKAETKFQKNVKEKIKDRFPNCLIMKQNNNGLQGTPDLLIVNGPKWVALECKDSEDAFHQPNQDYYVKTMNEMSFASFIFPENEEEVLNEVFKALQF